MRPPVKLVPANVDEFEIRVSMLDSPAYSRIGFLVTMNYGGHLIDSLLGAIEYVPQERRP